MKPLDRLREIAAREERLVLGLSSGTSADGVDALLLRITGSGVAIRVEPLVGSTFPYGPGLETAVREAGRASASEICRLNFALGEFFGACACELIHEAGFDLEDVHLIGSHGQTVCHLPRVPGVEPSTLQIAEADVIAEKTRIPVVADFRTRDVAAGGEGAPLVPYVDYLLFRRPDAAVATQNIGGIANVTVVTPELEDVFAFDTGPGNMPLDSIVRVITRGESSFDEDGRLAQKGRVDEDLMRTLLEHPFLEREPPKTTGREAFGDAWVMGILKQKGNLRLEDVLATMTHFVAKSIHDAYRRFVFPRADVREVLVSGGGVKNLTLLTHLKRMFSPVPVLSIAERGCDPDLKEAMTFAVLASETICGNPDNVPAATGARWPVVLGKISP